MNINRRFITIGLVLLCLALFAYAFLFETHTISLFDGNTEERTSADSYVESIEGGQLMRRKKDGKLYDAHSLVPDAAQVDDCPT